MNRQQLQSESQEQVHEEEPASEEDQPRRTSLDLNADLVQFYFRDIRPVSSLLTVEEEHSMAAEVQHGKQAQQRLRRNPSASGDERARLESAVCACLAVRPKMIVRHK